ncbi:MAG: beta-ureidopropionase / N-carbamoyl-L-amino-acid hydrolase [Alphaproteobacteria bacterium]|nr:beta-ureidopropionase / N-carbamoyl-L-amino-acid hydrolase [Alphaproteobacteria bacterium]
MIPINGDRVISDLRELATIGAFQTGVDRVAFSAVDIQARRWLVEKLRQAGLHGSMDRAGNVLGRDPKAAKAILVGSHTDTVPKGGWLDGALGVIYALEVARSAFKSGETSAVGVDVISFADEEGTFLSCFGSRIFCGDIAAPEIEAAESKDGTRLLRALDAVANEAPHHRIDRERHLCFLEAHIEQGPRLEAAGRRIAVVTGLVGIRRLRVRAFGRADHAGTTPMAMRRDAGATLIDFAAWVAQEFPKHAGPDTVWNIGSIAFQPGAANVVPSQSELVLEFRDTRADVLDLLEGLVSARVQAMNGQPVSMAAETISRIAPAAMTASLGAMISDAASSVGETAMHIPSGAGHDAMFVARVIPSAMMFVPSIGGRSHDISENTSDSDIVFGCRVFAEAVARARKSPQAFVAT